MTEEEQKHMAYLERVEKAARTACTAFTDAQDYEVWDRALDKLEQVLKEKA